MQSNEGVEGAGVQRAFKLHAVFLGNERKEKYALEQFLGHITDHNGKARVVLSHRVGAHVRRANAVGPMHPCTHRVWVTFRVSG